MSKTKKSKKLRRPNVPLATGPVVAQAMEARGGAAEMPRAARLEPARPAFDYSHIIKDLKRIGVLAGSFIVILIVLSFFLK